jgi:hypothetical protein
MAFLKKNWGLLLYSFACLVLAVLIGLNVRRAAIQASAKHKALDEQLQWFQTIEKDNLKLTKDNERAALDNRDRALSKFTEVRQAMAAKYRIDPRYPATPVEAVRELQTELRNINRMLDEAEPPVDYKSCPYLSFQTRAASKDLPTMEDVPKIFRQLNIVKEIALIVAESHLLSLSAIDRPMDLNVIEEDLYTATPVTLTVTGTADQVQSFINKMTVGAKYLFFLRNITLTTADQAPNGALGAASASPAAGAGAMPGMEGGPGMDAGMMAMGGMPMGGATAAAPRTPRTARPGRRTGTATPDAGMPGQPPGMPAMPGQPAMPMNPGVRGQGMPGAEGAKAGTAAQEPMWRDQLRAFVQDALVTAELRFDLIEFNQPEASQ